MPYIGSSCVDTLNRRFHYMSFHYDGQKAAGNLGWGCYLVGREEELRIPVFEKILLTQKGLIAAHVGKFRKGVCTSVYGFSCS